MAKGNLFLGYAAGKVGDVVFSRMDGEQVARARNRSPKNPRTALQLLQRVVMKSNSAAYSLMREICDHSFQGLQQGTPNQSRFSMLNVSMLRNRLAEVINSGDAADIINSTEANFASKSSTLAPINAYRVSEGTIPSLAVSGYGTGTAAMSRSWNMAISVVLPIPEAGHLNDVSYQQVVDALGLQRGDQITLLALTTDDSEAAADAGFFNGFHVARLILEPASGDMTEPFAVLDEDEGILSVNDPNPRNSGIGNLRYIQNRYLVIEVAGVDSRAGQAFSLAAGAVIVSRLVGSVWQRSREVLTLRPAGSDTTEGSLKYDYNVNLLGDAVRSYMTEANSTLYLNQAQ